MGTLRKSIWAAAGLTVLITAGCGGGSERRPINRSTPVESAAKIEQSLTTAASVSERTGNYASAVDYFRKLYEKDQNNVDFVTGLSRNLRYAGEAAQARLFMDLVVNRGLDGAAIRAEYGKAQLADGLAEKGVKNLSQAISMGDNLWQTHSALGAAYDRMEKYDEAQMSYERAILISPENPMIINNLALSLAVSGNLERAIELLERSATRPGATPQIRHNLALLHALDGDKKAARNMGRFDLPEKDVAKNLEYYEKFLHGDSHTRRR